ncbi:MAG: aspartate aminotransferase family protein [Nitrospinota bacterium]
MTKDFIALTDRYIAATYARYPIALVRGEGCMVWDSEGKKYCDFVSGLAVNNLGHSHPRIIEAIRRQAGELIHVSNLYHIPQQTELARMLVENSFADKVFFCNSGAEANEAAIKLTRRYHNDRGKGDRYEIITMTNSFHGRTMATITATGQEKFHKGFEPLVPGFKYVPFNDLSATEAALTKNTCAVMVEPIQGEGGVNLPAEGYLKGLREMCDAHNLLLIFDEVQTGIGRTGELFAYENYGVIPDIMTLAKSLGGGVAIGAMLAKGNIIKSFIPGTHAATFGGNPLACSAGIAALKAIMEEGIISNCKRVGAYFIEKLTGLKEKYSFILDIRGKGLMIGLELDFPGKDITITCMEKGFLINCTMENVLRFLPPLIIGEREVDQLIDILDGIFMGKVPKVS